MAPATSKPKEAIHKEDGQRNNNQKTANDKKKGNLNSFKLRIAFYILYLTSIGIAGLCYQLNFCRTVIISFSLVLSTTVILGIVCKQKYDIVVFVIYSIVKFVFLTFFMLYVFVSSIDIFFNVCSIFEIESNGGRISSENLDVFTQKTWQYALDLVFIAAAHIDVYINNKSLERVFLVKKRAEKLCESSTLNSKNLEKSKVVLKVRYNAKNQKIYKSQNSTGGHTGTGNPNYIVYVV